MKGLDFALLEQNKARAAASNIEDDDSLEKAFLEGTADTPIVPIKRTREELVRELKEKRSNNGSSLNDASLFRKSAEDEVKILEETKKTGKFKPIGSKCSATSDEVAKKSKILSKEGSRRKKKRKIENTVTDKQLTAEGKIVGRTPPPPLQSPIPDLEKNEPESPTDDFNIFEDVDDYEGADLGDDDEDETSGDFATRQDMNAEMTPLVGPRQWIESNESELASEPSKSDALAAMQRLSPVIQDVVQNNQPSRLQPLESSALPSIKDYLAMDEAISSSGRWKNKKKQKKK